MAALPELDILLTDANAMHKDARVARVLRALRLLTDLVPDFHGRDFNGATGLDMVKANVHLLQSLVWMADGRTMEALKSQGLEDADPSHQPTIQKFGIGIAQLDHIHYRQASVEVQEFTVHEEVRVSDHLPVSASLRVKP